MPDDIGDDSDDDGMGKINRKKGANSHHNKVYHLNTYTKLDSKITLHMISNEVQACENKQLTK